MANQMTDRRGPDHIVIDPNGCVEIRDEYHHQQVYAGALNFNNDVYNNRGDQDRDCQDRGYQNRGYQDRADQDPGYQDRGYQDRDYQNRGYQDRGYQDRSYQDRGYPDRDCQDRGYQDNYQQPEYRYYPQHPRYEQQGSIYIPDCYGNQERRGLDPGLAIGIGVVGGLLLNRALGNGGEYRSREHHRR